MAHFCEFGASDEIYSSNTFYLLKNCNFSGMAIELDEVKYKKCLENYKSFPNVKVFHGTVLFIMILITILMHGLKEVGCHETWMFFSIDIDSNDYYIWENLTEFDPKIVIIETNSYRDPVYEEAPGHPSSEYNRDLLQSGSGHVACGCSFNSAIKLGLEKGYVPISYTGNLTFVRGDLAHKLKEFPHKISSDPYDYLTLYSHLALWGDQWKTNTGLILNMAIRDYYLEFRTKNIDIEWINMRVDQILKNESVLFE